MARYLDVGTEIAERVRSGQLRQGAELPAIREGAWKYGATASTIGRAYRYLADGGAMTMTDRRRARGHHGRDDGGSPAAGSRPAIPAGRQ